ncbi:MAG: hypothetical protein Q8S18_14070 [Bacteroidales bacterium]|nr:hypothetical protein [Bacteroidales bacterium]
MKKYLISWQIKRKQAVKHLPVITTIEGADHVCLLVVVDSSAKVEWLKQISLQFIRLNPKFRLIVFVKGKKIEIPELVSNLIVVRPNDFNFFGFLRADILKKLESKCDLLLNLDRSGNIFLHYLTTLIPAGFLIRTTGNNESGLADFYDLTLNTPNMDDANILVKELAGYLRSLNGIENA